MVALAIAEPGYLPRPSAPHSRSNTSATAFDIDGSVLPVLDDVNFSVKPGEFIALFGGRPVCGKSTLLRPGRWT